ncbi:selenocysteine insertion sequence-binding protein 2 [Episyrphus balteatus]|uniref:selenocysteine insertion sequence-binding protein 2 n=1 Tax=Episyrphus balteatus TaxID=286459 RepID=UPI002485BA54|nr:selenocysteine insertion sequence-binding protein 2 [Episyrphus balteatus]
MSHHLSTNKKVSDKLRIIDENTFNQFSKNNKTTNIKKHKRSAQIPNLSQFINLKCQQHRKKPKRTAFAIYKVEKRKSVKKCKPKKRSKLKKTILKYRLLKRGHIDNSEEGKINSEVVKEFQNLTLEEPSKIKSVHSRRFREYCDNTTSQELSNLVDTLLRKLNHFQKRAFQLNNFKGKSRRRIVIGFREVQVQMKIDKMKCVIIATDCEKCDFEDGLDNIILEIRENCKKADIPCVFALQRRKLSYVLHQKCPTSCVGIVDYDGAQDNFFQLVNVLEVEKNNYKKLFE